MLVHGSSRSCGTVKRCFGSTVRHCVQAHTTTHNHTQTHTHARARIHARTVSNTRDNSALSTHSAFCGRDGAHTHIALNCWSRRVRYEPLAAERVLLALRAVAVVVVGSGDTHRSSHNDEAVVHIEAPCATGIGGACSVGGACRCDERLARGVGIGERHAPHIAKLAVAIDTIDDGRKRRRVAGVQ